MNVSLRHLLVLVLCVGSMGCDSASVDAPVLRTNLDAPALRTPLDGHARHVGPLVFQWSTVDDAATYDFRLERTDVPPASADVLRTADPSISLPFDQPGRYTWQVRARDALDQAGYWSERRTLSIE